MSRRIVLDTNLLVSAMLRPEGTCGVAAQIASKHFIPIGSDATIQELKTVISRSKFDKYVSTEQRNIHIEAYLNTLEQLTVLVNINDCTDPKDNKFLELAVSAEATLIVSGDKKHLLSMSPYLGIKIVTAREFVDHFDSFL